ncbi:hypothetical protein A2797_02265 [candidate division WWE3 bacterium RIFCSPHIGHO2_01_FULL_48_15]|uniref:3D domain-containing protein n=1 Tax=candidate division WWE3 bacterium RIFCSPHIGHO2_01_FULL_48_15 TaxID=1802619 RepID=A0A1F4VBW4_UNCKA|nr:MAG: hypothetical protein A2797_02265 [candidate division WWE3 bacterium RIFCSPHIGHO2_01_FULL_48_15]
MLEIAARGAVHSIFLLIIAGVIAFYPGSPIFKDSPTRVLGEKSNCLGIKLNYPRIITETINGEEFTFRYNCILKNFRATSYDGNCPGCSGRTHFTNEPVVRGICAIDQDVIAPHSTFYIPGYGPCKAADKGGGIKGKEIDLGFEDTAQSWWSARYTDVLILGE